MGATPHKKFVYYGELEYEGVTQFVKDSHGFGRSPQSHDSWEDRSTHERNSHKADFGKVHTQGLVVRRTNQLSELVFEGF